LTFDIQAAANYYKSQFWNKNEIEILVAHLHKFNYKKRFKYIKTNQQLNVILDGSWESCDCFVFMVIQQISEMLKGMII
jgi:hypothetical protein